jgi:membrane-associated phospholipid phosphatase
MDRKHPVELAPEPDLTDPPAGSVAGPGATEPGVMADFPEVTPDAPDEPPAPDTPSAPEAPEAPVPSPVTAVSVGVAAGLVFAALVIWVARRGAAVPAVDTAIHSWALSHRSPGSVAVANAVRWGGVTTVVLPALIVVGAAAASARRDVGRRLRSGLLLCLVASAGVYAEILINHAIDRGRPPVSDWAGAASGASFPSGHTTAATLFAISCAWAIAARVPAGWPRRWVWVAAAAYAVVVGWSRVWLGVHWPTDVIGGWLFGVAWFAGTVAVIRTLRRPAGDLWSRLRRPA